MPFGIGGGFGGGSGNGSGGNGRGGGPGPGPRGGNPGGPRPGHPGGPPPGARGFGFHGGHHSRGRGRGGMRGRGFFGGARGFFHGMAPPAPSIASHPGSSLNSQRSTVRQVIDPQADNEDLIDSLPSILPVQFCLAFAVTLGVLALIECGVMLISNLLATKVWTLWIFDVDGGLILFPITYVVSDMISEIYRKQFAKVIATSCAILNLVAFSCFFIVDAIPSASGSANIPLTEAFNLSGRLIIASSLAFLLSNLVNADIYDFLRHFTRDDQIRLRAWLSSLVGRAIDTPVFTLIGFFGTRMFSDLAWQMFSSWLVGMIVETVLMLIAPHLTGALKSKLDTLQTYSEQ